MTASENMAFEAAKKARKRARHEWRNAEGAPGTLSKHGHESTARACDSLAGEIILLAFPNCDLGPLLKQIDGELARGD
jgi:hypothetical protein